MSRKGMTAEAVKNFKKPLAKKKARAAGRAHDDELEGQMTAKVTSVKRERQDYTDSKSISAGALRGIMDETIARVYAEIWPSMTTTDDYGNVHHDLREESYILSLTMVCGNFDYSPRKGLKMREAPISDTAKFCKEHR